MEKQGDPFTRRSTATLLCYVALWRGFVVPGVRVRSTSLFRGNRRRSMQQKRSQGNRNGLRWCSHLLRPVPPVALFFLGSVIVFVNAPLLLVGEIRHLQDVRPTSKAAKGKANGRVTAPRLALRQAKQPCKNNQTHRSKKERKIRPILTKHTTRKQNGQTQTNGPTPTRQGVPFREATTREGAPLGSPLRIPPTLPLPRCRPSLGLPSVAPCRSTGGRHVDGRISWD